MNLIYAATVLFGWSSVMAGTNLFGQLHNAFKNVSPSCATPLQTSVHPPPNPADLWTRLTPSERRTVTRCHARLPTSCYDGFLSFVDRGYEKADVKRICMFYYDTWQPCCPATDPATWTGVFKSRCPTYMANCPEFEDEFRAMKANGTWRPVAPDYRTVQPRNPSKFNELCPDYLRYCATTDNVKTAVSSISICLSLAVYSDVQDCDVTYSADTRRQRSLRGRCKKYKFNCA